MILKFALRNGASSQEFSVMLASPANQLTNGETTAVTPARTANILTLEFSGVQHEPVLLAPGKWSIGSSTSNQIVLDNDGVALRQFLIIVTEHRSVIKDWSASGLWNGRSFDSAVLADGDKVQVADVELSFRVAKSLDLISQLPYVADNDCSHLVKSDADSVAEAFEQSPRNAEYVTADGMLSFEDSEDRLDGLISRIESSVTSDMPRQTVEELNVCLPQRDLRSSETQPVIDEITTAVTRSNDSTLESQSARIDEELRQLEELRAAVQQEREQLLEKRALLAQESLQVTSQLKAVRDSGEAMDCFDETVQCRDDFVDESASAESDGNPEVSDEVDPDELIFDFGKMQLNSSTDDNETETTVAAEREKLRHLLEEFDSVNDASGDEAANVEVAVGVAQTNAEYSVMNALRSRDDAVKQLDELVLAATREQEHPTPASGESMSGRTTDVPSQQSVRWSTAVPTGEYDSELSDSAEDHDSSALSNEPDTEHEPDTNVEASIAELGALIDEVDAGATPFTDDTFKLSAGETVLCSETNGEADTVVPDETALLDRHNVESHLDDDSPAWDLTALMKGLDASNEESHSSAADDGSVPTIQFENEDLSPKFDQRITEVADFDEIADEVADFDSGAEFDEVAEFGSGTFERSSARQDADEDSFTLQSSDIYEIVEEPQSESVTAEPFAGPESTADPLEVDALADGVDSESFDTDSNAEVFGEERQSDAAAHVDSEAPSWFESKFMAEGNSVAENEPLDENADAELAAADDVSNSETDESATDLRQKLAEMFDLPALSENTASIVPDEALESRLQQFRNEPQPEILADTQTDDSSEPWSSAESTDPGSTPAGTLNFDPVSNSSTEDDSAFESETLDEFPSAVSEENAEADSTSAANAKESFEPAKTSDEDDSISAYMERLLARNRQVTGKSPTQDESASTASTAEPMPAPTALKTSSDHEPDSSTDVEEQRETWLEDTPRHRQNRDQVRADVQVLRQIANQSARSAVATASRRDIRKQVIVKTIASVLALTTGTASLLLDVSMLFGLVVLCIGLLFSGDLTLTIFRNWKYIRNLKRTAAELKGRTSSQTDGRASNDADSTVE